MFYVKKEKFSDPAGQIAASIVNQLLCKTVNPQFCECEMPTCFIYKMRPILHIEQVGIPKLQTVAFGKYKNILTYVLHNY